MLEIGLLLHFLSNKNIIWWSLFVKVQYSNRIYCLFNYDFQCPINYLLSGAVPSLNLPCEREVSKSQFQQVCICALRK